jgi:hypothetical protein
MSAATEFAPAVPLPQAPRRRLAAVPSLPSALVVPPPDAQVTVLHRPGTAGQAAPLRLTRRGVVVVAAALTALGAALVWLAAASAAPAPTQAAPRVHAVTVAPDDTLWSIAGRVAPGRDPRAEVAALQRRNRLAGVDLTPGQRLLVP